MDTFVRWAGGCWISAGVLLLAELAHPDALGIGFAASSRQSLWPAVHVAWVLVTILTLFGLAGLVGRFGPVLGRLGTAGAVLAVPGLVVAAGLFLTEAFVFPVLAREDPGLLDLDGRFLGSWAFRLIGGLVATVLFGALEGPFVPVAGEIAVVVFAAAHVWLGMALVRAGLPPSPIGEARSRTATREGTTR